MTTGTDPAVTRSTRLAKTLVETGLKLGIPVPTLAATTITHMVRALVETAGRVWTAELLMTLAEDVAEGAGEPEETAGPEAAFR